MGWHGIERRPYFNMHILNVCMYVCMYVLQEFLKSVRRQYLQAHEQIFFPLNIEVQKAETRVMTYLARDEIRCVAYPCWSWLLGRVG